MSITKEQVQLVKDSWRSLRGIRPELIAELFYSRLFADHPRLRKMFPENMHQQYLKLVDMLNSIVIWLDQPGRLTNEVTEMAKRHAGYGIKSVHYTMVGNALLWTLRRALGNEWQPPTEAAWKACYNMLAGVMITEQGA